MSSSRHRFFWLVVIFAASLAAALLPQPTYADCSRSPHLPECQRRSPPPIVIVVPPPVVLVALPAAPPQPVVCDGGVIVPPGAACPPMTPCPSPDGGWPVWVPSGQRCPPVPEPAVCPDGRIVSVDQLCPSPPTPVTAAVLTSQPTFGCQSLGPGPGCQPPALLSLPIAGCFGRSTLRLELPGGLVSFGADSSLTIYRYDRNRYRMEAAWSTSSEAYAQALLQFISGDVGVDSQFRPLLRIERRPLRPDYDLPLSDGEYMWSGGDVLVAGYVAVSDLFEHGDIDAAVADVGARIATVHVRGARVGPDITTCSLRFQINLRPEDDGEQR